MAIVWIVQRQRSIKICFITAYYIFMGLLGLFTVYGKKDSILILFKPSSSSLCQRRNMSDLRYMSKWKTWNSSVGETPTVDSVFHIDNWRNYCTKFSSWFLTITVFALNLVFWRNIATFWRKIYLANAILVSIIFLKTKYSWELNDVVCHILGILLKKLVELKKILCFFKKMFKFFYHKDTLFKILFHFKHSYVYELIFLRHALKLYITWA